MATFSFKTIQKIPTDLETAWSFFSDAGNLQAITPRNLGINHPVGSNRCENVPRADH